MDRNKLIEAIRLSIARVLDFKTGKRELELLADHLIENGIGIDDEAKIYSLQMADGKIDMKVGGKEFSNLVNMLYQTFKQNGGKNFFTTSFGFDRDDDHYEMTIQKINGQGTAEKLSELKHRAEVAEEALKSAVESIHYYAYQEMYGCVVKDLTIDYFKQQASERLKERM